MPSEYLADHGAIPAARFVKAWILASRFPTGARSPRDTVVVFREGLSLPTGEQQIAKEQDGLYQMPGRSGTVLLGINGLKSFQRNPPHRPH